jgi:tyrosyl-tRNA synthetase
LARELVSLYHDKDAALTAEKEFDVLFIQKDEPDDMPEYKLAESEKLIGIMVKNGMVASNGEGKRMISQGGVRLDKEKVDDIHSTIEPGKNVVLKVGKRKFLRIIK